MCIRDRYGVLALIPGGIGLGIAARHVWLTHLPADQVPECGPPLQFMMDTCLLYTSRCV